VHGLAWFSKYSFYIFIISAPLPRRRGTISNNNHQEFAIRREVLRINTVVSATLQPNFVVEIFNHRSSSKQTQPAATSLALNSGMIAKLQCF
jgi:hypothetical protein